MHAQLDPTQQRACLRSAHYGAHNGLTATIVTIEYDVNEREGRGRPTWIRRQRFLARASPASFAAFAPQRLPLTGQFLLTARAQQLRAASGGGSSAARPDEMTPVSPASAAYLYGAVHDPPRLATSTSSARTRR